MVDVVFVFGDIRHGNEDPVVSQMTVKRVQIGGFCQQLVVAAINGFRCGHHVEGSAFVIGFYSILSDGLLPQLIVVIVFLPGLAESEKTFAIGAQQAAFVKALGFNRLAFDVVFGDFLQCSDGDGYIVDAWAGVGKRTVESIEVIFTWVVGFGHEIVIFEFGETSETIGDFYDFMPFGQRGQVGDGVASQVCHAFLA